MAGKQKKAGRHRTYLGKRIKRPSRGGFAAVTVLLAIVLALGAGGFMLRSYAGVLDNVLFVKAPPEEAVREITEEARAVTLEEAEEGIVLLLNKDGALPLKERSINVFGRGGIYSTFGGTGSGAGGTNYVNLYDGLQKAGFTLNPELADFYRKNAKVGKSMGIVGTDYGLYENAPEELPEDLIENAKRFSDIAIYVISRIGGESTDLPMDTAAYSGGEKGRHYLELSRNEEGMLELLRSRFDTVIVVLNSTNAMELGFLERDGVDAALWTECFGSVGTIGLGHLLSGEANPSGRTSDTFAYEVESNPTYYSFGAYDYMNVSYVNTGLAAGTGDADSGANPYHYVKYNEGIYVGYRYYETAAEEGFIDYDRTVQFPFGYGLSYTDFTQTLDSVSFDGNTVRADVTVKNTGNEAGKDVVEIYYSAPYTPGGIEKSAVVLGGFAKTGLLAPGAEEKVTVTFRAEDMASFDSRGIKAEGGAYVLEAGEYEIRLQIDSHNVIDSKTVTVEKDVIYNSSNGGSRPSDGVPAVSRFSEAETDGNVVFLSRADFAGTFPKERAASAETAPDSVVQALTGRKTVIEDRSPAVWKTADSGLRLSDMRGVPYDDPKWEKLLDQVSKKEMKELIETGGWQSAAAPSVGKARYLECDGPNGINNLMANLFSGIKGNMYTNQSTLAKTWNPDLAYRKGLVYGREAKAYGVAGIYGPAVNIHRSPFSGRNYEYYSEDGLLSGVMAEREVAGIYESGVYCFVKHFAANDQETHRADGGLITWLSEQALREIYLKGFEIAVKGGNLTGIMSSYNRIGTVPTAESRELLCGVLRDEWGFTGSVVTDCVMAATTEDINRSLLAGNDFQLNFGFLSSLSKEITETVSGQKAMRQAVKNMFYTEANSDAPELYRIRRTVSETVLPVLFLVLLLVFAQYYIRYFLRLGKWKRGEPVVTAEEKHD